MSQGNIQMIESKIDRGLAGALPVNSQSGGMVFNSMSDVMEFSKLMAIGGVSIPQHLRGQVGSCLAVCIQAIEWRMSPYAVANKSYVVNDRISYESQLIHAVIEQRAPIVGRLKNRFIGEGNTRQCIVWAEVKGEKEPLEYTSPTFAQITTKNSPLWKSKPDLQLYYNASRDWARMYFPDVILGVYAEDELPDDRMQAGTVMATATPARITSIDQLTERLVKPKPAETSGSGDCTSESSSVHTATEYKPEPEPEPQNEAGSGEKSEPSSIHPDSAPIAAPAAGDFTELVTKLAACKTMAECGVVLDNAYPPDRTHEQAEYDRAVDLCEERKQQIRAARTAKP